MFLNNFMQHLWLILLRPDQPKSQNTNSKNHKKLKDAKKPYFLQPLLLTVAQECPKKAGEQVFQDGYQEVFVKLKS